MCKIIKISTISIVIIALAVFAALEFEYIISNDISIESISKADNPDFQATTYHHREPVYLVSYVDGNEVFYKNQNALVQSGLNKGIDFFLNYRRSHIDPEFYNKHKTILQKPRGAGYWLWKPYVILKTMETVPENSIIIYSDAGFVFKSSLKPLIDAAKVHDITLIKYDPVVHGLVKNRARREILKRMDCQTEECKNNFHIWAGFSVYRNTARARHFVREWLKYCTDEVIIFGEQGKEPENPEFQYHQDDETVLTVMHAKHPGWCNLVTDNELSKLTVWHHRHPARVDESVMHNMQKYYFKLSKKILGSKPVVAIMEYLKLKMPIKAN